MPKITKPVDGVPAEVFFDKAREDPYAHYAFKEDEEGEDPKEIESKEAAYREVFYNAIDDIRRLLDGDVCLTDQQQRGFYFPFRSLIAKKLILKGGNNVEVFDLAGMDLESDGATVVGIATLLNSYRLSCQNCLNGKCPKRDPDSPVPVEVADKLA